MWEKSRVRVRVCASVLVCEYECVRGERRGRVFRMCVYRKVCVCVS